MNIFEKIHVQGFRRLHDLDLRLKPLNVVIGANGSGKTSLLDVFSLLAASAFGRLKETMSDLSGIDANLTNLLAAKGNKARFMAFDLAMGVPGHNPIEYRIAMTPQGVGYEISDEVLTQQRHESRSRSSTFKHITATCDTSSRKTDRKGVSFERTGITTRPNRRSRRFRKCFKNRRNFASVWHPRLTITFST